MKLLLILAVLTTAGCASNNTRPLVQTLGKVLVAKTKAQVAENSKVRRDDRQTERNARQLKRNADGGYTK